jgi:hypothetical protein
MSEGRTSAGRLLGCPETRGTVKQSRKYESELGHSETRIIGKGRREASRLQCHPVVGHFPSDKRPRNGLVRLRCDAPATDPTEQPQSSVKVGPDPPWGWGVHWTGAVLLLGGASTAYGDLRAQRQERLPVGGLFPLLALTKHWYVPSGAPNGYHPARLSHAGTVAEVTPTCWPRCKATGGGDSEGKHFSQSEQELGFLGANSIL